MRRKALVTMLELIKPALADQDLVPVYQNFVFTGDTLYATDDHLGIVAKCTSGVAPFACHGDTMLGLLRNCRTEEVEIEFDDQQHEVVFIAGRSKMRLPYLPESEFLFKEPSDESWDVVLDLDDSLIEAMEICLTTTSKDSSQQALMGITLDTGDGISFYSCDSDSLTHYLIDGANYNDPHSFVMPNSFCESVLRICKSDKSMNGRLHASDEWVLAELEKDYKVYGRVIKPEDPVDHAMWVEKTTRDEIPWMKVPKGLEHALSRARVVAEPKSQPTEISIKEGRMRLYTNTDMGEVRDLVNLQGDHPDVEIKVNAALMARSIDVCSEMAVLEGFTVYRKGADLFQILSNFGD